MSSPDPSWGDRPQRQFSFGDFTLDLDGGVLRRANQEIPLRPKPFAVLAYLVERHGRLVSKTELIEAVWPDAAVTDNSLVQCLREIRRALEDESQQLIRTVARRGYIFTATVITPVMELPRDPGPVPTRPPQRENRRIGVAAGLIAVVLAGGGALIVWRVERHAAPARLKYEPLTHFADSATCPALSPDGRMLAFIRSEYTFGGPGQIYVKLLPDGDPVQLTHDDLEKRGSPKFSPDGTLIAYAALRSGSGWDTWVVPVLGGQSRLFLANASGLTWIEGGPQFRLLFSELTGRGHQMAIVTSTGSRAQHRSIYVPSVTGMAHRSYLSPDRKQVLVVEMDNSAWLPCRLATFAGNSPGKPVGPARPLHGCRLVPGREVDVFLRR